MSTAEIDALRERLEAAENAGDPTVLTELMDPETYVRMPPGRPRMDAEEAETALESLYASTDISANWNSDGVLIDGDLAVDSGTFRVQVTAEDGAITEQRGNWLMVYQRADDGRWRLVRDIYNFDAESGVTES